jgi:hypothetical protein
MREGLRNTVGVILLILWSLPAAAFGVGAVSAVVGKESTDLTTLEQIIGGALALGPQNAVNSGFPAPAETW